MKFSATIKQLREETGASQQDVADAMGIARATYASLEADRRPPNLDEIYKLARYFEVSEMSLVLGRLENNSDSEVNEPPARYNYAKNDNPTPPQNHVQVLNPEKLREVLLYVTEKVGAKPNIGEAALYRLLYFIDFYYYEKTGQSITGLTYIRNHFGPVPARDFANVVEEMKVAKELEVIETKNFKNKQKKYLPLKFAKLQAFRADELRHIDETLAHVAGKTADELSALAQNDRPWLVAQPDEPIAYEQVFQRTQHTAFTHTDVKR